MFEQFLQKFRQQRPLTGCYTNFVTVNDCANILLSAGASPVMTLAAEESVQFGQQCDAILINIGTVYPDSLRAMILAGQSANQSDHKVVLDPVGVSFTQFRTQAVAELLDKVHFAVIRGNLTEIRSIAGEVAQVRGVDAGAGDLADGAMAPVVALAKAAAAKYDCVIVISGKRDVVATAQKALIIDNGHALMGNLCGTGCMQGALLAAMCGTNNTDTFIAAAAAVGLIALAGERAAASGEKLGDQSGFHAGLLYQCGVIDDAILERDLHYEVC